MALEKIALTMDRAEGRAVHYALGAIVQLMDDLAEIPPDAPLYGQRDRLVAAARRLDHELNCVHEGESCQICGQPYEYVWWCFDPILWEAVTGHAKTGREDAAGLLCIPCFDRLAKDRACWLEWAPLNLRHLERHPRCGVGKAA